MSLDNDHEYQTKAKGTAQQLIAAIDEESSEVLKLVEKLRRVRTSAFGGGFDTRLYKDTINLLDKVESQVESGTLACDENEMDAALTKTRELLHHYKATNSFDAKADDREVDVEGGLSF